VVVLLVVGAVISLGIARGELYYFGDEMRHAMNGVFFRDAFVDRPWSHPLQYAREYYAKYPALALVHWPPLFYVVEGVFFLVLGISVWVSRLAVLCFALLGVYFWYRLAELEGPRHRAIFSALIFPLLPFVLLYERVTMLEIPILSMCLGALYFWRKFLASERAGDLWGMAGFTIGAFLTSQKAIFLVVFVGLSFLLGLRFRLLRRWDTWLALAAYVAVVLPWYWFSFQVLSVGADRAVGGHVPRLLEHLPAQFAVYPKLLPHQMGIWLTALAVGGVVWALLRAPRRHGFMLLWVISCYLCFSLIWEKDVRHTMIWVPPLLWFSLLALEILFGGRRMALVACSLVGSLVVVNALRDERPYLKGMEDAARFVLDQPETDIVYYQGALNGNFIFHVRRLDPQKSHLVAREKQVAATQIMYAKRAILHTPEEILNFFHTWGIRYAVVENRDYLEEFGPVRQLLRTDHFELVRVFALESNDPGLADRKVYVYRLRGATARREQPVVIPMMTLREDIRVDLNRLAGRPWPN
jgi:hypothetical protein